MPQVLSNIVRESQEPLLLGSSLLHRINYKYGTTIGFPAMGAFQVADMAEGQEYSEVGPSMGGSTVTATVGKVGLAIRVTEEMIRYSQYDVIGMMLRKAGEAFGRHKERKIWNMVRNVGPALFDNVSPTQSLKGVTTGRDITGAGNGSLAADDLFDAFAHLIAQGYVPNTLIMHPLSWSMFVKDATLRAFVLQNGGGTWFAGWTGNPAARAPWANLGGQGAANGQSIVPAGTPSSETVTQTAGFNPFNLTSAPMLPSHWNLPFRVLVTPYVHFDSRRKLTDIYICDSNYLGALVVDEELSTDEFMDNSRDMRKIKLRERYAPVILEEGLAVAKIKNVHVVPNEIVLPVQATLDVSGSLPVINPTDSVL